MIRQLILASEAASRPQPHHIADEQHPDHQLGINRVPSDVALDTAHLFVQTSQTQEAVYAPQKMIGRDMRLGSNALNSRA